MTVNSRFWPDGVRGCLSRLAVRDQDARRFVLPDQEDEPDSDLHEILPPYAVDVQRAWSSPFFRQMAGKTQVAPFPTNVHARNRLGHVLDVAANARVFARVVGANEDLTLAGALWHDVGAPPFAHQGEEEMTKACGREFRHETFGAWLLRHVARNGRGLNLTYQTCRIVRDHSRGKSSFDVSDVAQVETAIVLKCDKLYLVYDYGDVEAGRYGILRFSPSDWSDLQDIMGALGPTTDDRIRACLRQMAMETAQKGQVSFDDCEAARLLNAAKAPMYRAYESKDMDDCRRMFQDVYGRVKDGLPEHDPTVITALMTDDDVRRLAVAAGPIGETQLKRLAVGEYLQALRQVKFDNDDDGLDW